MSAGNPGRWARWILKGTRRLTPWHIMPRGDGACLCGANAPMQREHTRVMTARTLPRGTTKQDVCPKCAEVATRHTNEQGEAPRILLGTESNMKAVLRERAQQEQLRGERRS